MKVTNTSGSAYISQRTEVEQKTVQQKTVAAKPVQHAPKQEPTQDIQPDSTINVPQGSHLVQEKETLYSIANHYGTSVAELVNLNPDLKTDKNGNKIIYAGSVIKVSATVIEEPDVSESDSQVFGSWQIEKGKGTYSIMSKFNLFKEELQKLNPDIDLDNIKAEDVFKVPGYKVKADDTLEEIAQAHDITVEMLLTLNPKFKDLKAGDILNVPKLAGQDLGFEDLEVEFDVVEETPAKIQHTVQAGDVLSVIAEKYHVPMWAIMLHNGIKDEDKIFKDQVLEMPTQEEIAELEKLKTQAEKPSQKQPQVVKYTVKNGDALSLIAEKYGVSVASIMYKNNITNPKHIQPKQVLVIPNKEEVAQLEAKQKELKAKQAAPKEQKQKISSDVSKAEVPENIIKSNLGIVVHKVKKEDTLKSISEKYGIPTEDLLTYNENLKGVKLTDNLSDKEIKSIKIIATKKAVIDGTGVSKKFIDDLIAIEKKHNKLYNDACGIPTIGIGHNTRANNDTRKYAGKTISDNEVYSLLARDIIKAQKTIRDAIGKDAFDKLSGGQKEALYGLVFNTGSLSGSPKLITALKNGDYVTAACEMNQAAGTINGKKQVLPGLAKRRLMDMSKFMQASGLSRKEQMKVMDSIQNIYDSGFANIKRQNTKVDYNAYAKKFLGKYIDKGWIKIKE